MSVQVVMEEKLHYLRDYELQKKADHSPEWIRLLQEKAMDRFISLNFPTTKEEEWRFTNVASIARIPFRTFFEQRFVEPSLQQIEPLLLESFDWPRLVFVNGRFSPELSFVSGLPEGVRLENFAKAVLKPDGMEEHLGRHAKSLENAFVALNTAFIEEGALVQIPDGVVVEKPIQLLFVFTSLQDVAFHPRTLICTGKGSIATIIESYVGLSVGRYLTNAVTEVVLGNGSVLEHCKIQSENIKGFHIATTEVHQSRDSCYSSFVLNLGAELSRQDLNVLMDGEGGDCNLNGLYLISGTQHADHHTNIDHARPHGTSQELYKGILDGKSRAVFNGKIIVRKGAVRTDAKQTNKNLLLSDHARVNTKPQLEILADDVKCSHGATIGHLDEEALFYLKTRGMSEQNARTLLMYGFINDVSARLKTEAVREKLNSILMHRLEQFCVPQEAV